MSPHSKLSVQNPLILQYCVILNRCIGLVPLSIIRQGRSIILIAGSSLLDPENDRLEENDAVIGVVTKIQFV